MFLLKSHLYSIIKYEDSLYETSISSIWHMKRVIGVSPCFPHGLEISSVLKKTTVDTHIQIVHDICSNRKNIYQNQSL